jgi:predicted secreted protein
MLKVESHKISLRLFRLGFRWLTVFAVLGLLASTRPLQAAPAATHTFTEKDSGRTVTLKVGDRLRLNLRNPGDGGYSVLPPRYSDKVLTLLSREDLPPVKRPQPLMGDFGRIVFTWQARQPGSTAVTVNIARPWEKNKAPQKFVQIKVVVAR